MCRHWGDSHNFKKLLHLKSEICRNLLRQSHSLPVIASLFLVQTKKKVINGRGPLKKKFGTPLAALTILLETFQFILVTIIFLNSYFASMETILFVSCKWAVKIYPFLICCLHFFYRTGYDYKVNCTGPSLFIHIYVTDELKMIQLALSIYRTATLFSIINYND